MTSPEKKLFALIVASGLVLRVILAFAISLPLKSDSVTYNELAISILNGSYSIGGHATAFVVPGYPLFLSAVYKIFGQGQFYVRIIQSAIDIATGIIFFFVSKNFFDTRRALICFAVFVLFPSNVLFSQTILTETLFGFFYMIVIYSCLRNDFTARIILTGIFFGLAVMVRSSFSFAMILVPLYFFVKRKELFGSKEAKRALSSAAVFAVGFLIVVSPWIIRNKIQLGAFTLATQGGSTLWEGNNPDATGTWNSEAVNSNPLFDNPDEIYREREFYRSAKEYIAGHPLKFLALGVKKIAYLFSSERMIVLYFTDTAAGETSTQAYRSSSPLLLALVNIPYLIIMLTGTWGLIAIHEKIFFIRGFILMWLVTIFIFVGLARYHYVLIPFFVIGSVKFFSGSKDMLSRLSVPEKFTGAAFSIFLLAVWSSEIYLMYFK